MKRVSLYMAAILSLTAVFGYGSMQPAYLVEAGEDIPGPEAGEEITLLPELEVDPTGVDYEGGGAGFSGNDTLMPEVDVPADDGGDTLMPEVNPTDNAGNGDTLMPEVNPSENSGSGSSDAVSAPDSGSSKDSGTSKDSSTDSGSSGKKKKKDAKSSEKDGNQAKSGDNGETDSGNSGSSGNGSSGSGSSGSGSSANSGAASSDAATKPAVEETEPYTVTGKLAVDKNAVLRVLAMYGTSEEALSSWTTLLEQLSVSKDTLVMANGGARYDLTRKDGSTVTLLEEADSEGSGSVIAGSLFQDCLLTRPGGQQLLKELAVSKGANPRDVKAAAEKAVSAIKEVADPEGPEATKIYAACTGLMHALPEALLLYSAGFDALEEQLGLSIPADRLQSVKAFAMTEDTEGTSYILSVTPADAGSSPIRMTLKVNGDEIDLTAESASATLSYHHYADGAEVRLKSTGTRIPFRLSASILIDEEITGCTRLYLADGEDPAAVKFSTLKAGGERTASIDKDGKERLAVGEIAEHAAETAEKLQQMNYGERQAFAAFFSI